MGLQQASVVAARIIKDYSTSILPDVPSDVAKLEAWIKEIEHLLGEGRNKEAIIEVGKGLASEFMRSLNQLERVGKDGSDLISALAEP